MGSKDDMHTWVTGENSGGTEGVKMRALVEHRIYLITCYVNFFQYVTNLSIYSKDGGTTLNWGSTCPPRASHSSATG